MANVSGKCYKGLPRQPVGCRGATGRGPTGYVSDALVIAESTPNMLQHVYLYDNILFIIFQNPTYDLPGYVSLRKGCREMSTFG